VVGTTPAQVTVLSNLYSLPETAKANRIEPYVYLRHIFTPPAAQSIEQLEALLPINLGRTCCTESFA